ncbi:2'-5' RNA ligase family protein [Actinomycetospora lutea]|uniref:2'-5' RNA ligase family protein n=1 Tax=Actinomycetospora lutea TaxID=663604 RepID=UPI0023666118|nr:2'-5' RNA ligase family protein [Actinomycetospora lutea]MDD7939444.1 2'-5' RNA ligase family protein [Actinomycetospora lutea]
MPVDPAARRTMIAALVPDAEPLVGPFRAELDPTARRGLGAHLTLVRPFVAPGRVAAGTVAALRDAVAAVPAFPCTFAALRWFGEKVLWLAPEPVAAFREIAGRIRAAFPELPAEDRELVPHLTVGLRRAASASALRAAEAALAPRLPLTVRVDRVALMVRTETWDVAAEVPLGVSPSGPPGLGSPGSP